MHAAMVRACSGCSSSSRFPGGIPSHVAPGDAGLDPRGRRARLRAARTRTAPRSTTRTSIVACVVGDGEAETGAARQRSGTRTSS